MEEGKGGDGKEDREIGREGRKEGKAPDLFKSTMFYDVHGIILEAV